MALAGGALLLALAGIATPGVVDSVWWRWKSHIEFNREPEEREAYHEFFGPWGGGTFSYRTSRDTACYLQRRTEPGDYLYVWGYDPLIYLLAQRPSSSRFIYSFPSMSNWAPRSWPGELLADLEQRPPVSLVVQRFDGARWIAGHTIDAGDYVAWFPELEAWLRQD